MNTVPQDKTHYSSSLKDFAEVDNKLAASQLAIGESSNVAQLALTYTYNFNDQKYDDAVCILSVVAQIAIDNAKRKSAIEDLNKEIKYLRTLIDVDKNGLPLFWQITKKDKRKARSEDERRKRDKENKTKIRKRINSDLVCPMNYIFDIDLKQSKSPDSSIPISKFFINHENKEHRRKSKKVEEFIQKYSMELYNLNTTDDEDQESYLLLRSDFEQLIKDIRGINISGNYLGLMSQLINRAFMITPYMQSNKDKIESKLSKNKPLLMKVLYEVNKSSFLACFKGKVDTE